MVQPTKPGVGIDLAERSTWRHLDEAAVRRAALRWLAPAERTWCAAQPSFREAVVLVLSCKEAAYKAGAGPAPYALSLVMEGTLASGWAVTAAGRPESVVARWEATSDSILTLAVLDSPEKAWTVLDRLAAGVVRSLDPVRRC